MLLKLNGYVKKMTWAWPTHGRGRACPCPAFRGSAQGQGLAQPGASAALRL